MVIASHKCRGVELAGQAGLTAHWCNISKMPSREAYSDRIDSLLDGAGVDLVVMAGFCRYGRSRPGTKARSSTFTQRCCRPSAGADVQATAFTRPCSRGCKVSGCTVHYVTNEYDAGPIILQKCVPVLENDTPNALAARRRAGNARPARGDTTHRRGTHAD